MNEIKVLEMINEQLETLQSDPEKLRRTLQWIYDKYSPVALTTQGKSQIGESAPIATIASTEIPNATMPTNTDIYNFSKLISEIPKTTEADRFLLAIYCYTEEDTEKEFRNRDINKILHNAGYKTKNTSNCIRDLLKPSPAYLSRHGSTSKKGDVIYKITNAGIAKAKEIIKNGREN